MHRAILLAVLLIAAANAISQSAPASQASDFEGEWKAQFQKKILLVLTLVRTKTLTDSRYPGEILGGTLSHATEISADNEGDITKVGDDMSTAQIFHSEIHGRTLQFDTKDEDGSEDHYIFVLTGKDTADLQPAVNGASAPKPFKLKRTVPPQK